MQHAPLRFKETGFAASSGCAGILPAPERGAAAPQRGRTARPYDGLHISIFVHLSIGHEI